MIESTRSLAQFDLAALDSRSYRRVKPGGHDALIRLYATGYWVTRRLEEKQPSVLVELLKERRSVREVTRTAGSALRLSTVS